MKKGKTLFRKDNGKEGKLDDLITANEKNASALVIENNKGISKNDDRGNNKSGLKAKKGKVQQFILRYPSIRN